MAADTLAGPAEAVAAALKSAQQTVAVAESSTGGLISARLLAVPGASAYYLGGSVIYTMEARGQLLAMSRTELKRYEPLTDEYVSRCARAIQTRLDATWGLAELGATGPAGTPYGHPPGICVLAVTGPVNLTKRIETGPGDREANMQRFCNEAFALFNQALGGA
ncbi:MAG: CinA family protein [Pseudomonadota bacterium]